MEYIVRSGGLALLLLFATLLAGCGGDDDDDPDPEKDARLRSLVLANATLDPEFDRDDNDYTAEVANTVTETTVTPTTIQAAATVTVNATAVASGTASAPIPLAVGDTTITVRVTAPDGTRQRTYTVVVTRRPPPSSNAALLDIELSAAGLDQIFDPGVMSYTASTGHFGVSTTVTARPEDEGATIEVAGEPVPAGEPSAYLPLDVGDTDLAVDVTAEDGVGMRSYAVTVTRAGAAAAGLEAYVKASNPDPDEFGSAVALTGDTLAVGAPGESSAATGVDGDEDDDTLADAGAAYVFSRAGTVWSQQAYVKASASDGGDRFGTAVGAAADLLAVGAPGEDSLDGGVDGDDTDDTGSQAGAVYLFARDGMNVWAQSAYLKAAQPDSGDEFGAAVAAGGGRVIVGAALEDGADGGVNGDAADDSASGAGAAYVFAADDDGDWQQQAYLKSSNPDAGDQFGSAVVIGRGIAAVGAPLEDSAATGIDGDAANDAAASAGAVFVFAADGDGDWEQAAYVKASNTDAGDRFGAAVAISGDLLAVGAPGEDSAATGVNGEQDDDTLDAPGAVYVFERDEDGDWSQVAYVKASNPGSLDNFGAAVALEGNLLAVGAPGENSAATGIGGDQASNAALDAGAVYVFARDGGGDWSQIAYVKASDTDANDEFGTAVAADGDSIVAGAPFEDGGDSGVGGDDGDDSVADAGAAYVIR